MLIHTGLHWTRFASAIQQRQYLNSLDLKVAPAYLILSGLLWALAGTTLAYGLWRALSWAPKMAKAGSLLFAAYYWLDRLLLQRSASNANSNQVFAAAASIVLLAAIFWLLSRPAARTYFGESNE